MQEKTKAIHGLTNKEKQHKFQKGIASPISISSSFYFNTIKEAQGAFAGEHQGYVYSRGRNPSQEEFEEKMTLLEEGSFAVAFASGMGAIATTLLALLKPEDTLLAHSMLYGSSHNLIKNLLPEYGIKTIMTDLNTIDEEKIGQLKAESRRLVIYFETPVNPTLETISIEDIRSKTGSETIIIVDNTFATPILQKPLLLGADLVLHSCTKYIGGHGDAVGGIVIGKDLAWENTLRYGYMCEFGATMAPFNAWLFNRGLKTLSLRVLEHQKNAKEIAAYLKTEKLVEKVYYPGFGGMVAFTLKGDAVAFVEALKLFTLAVSLGDVESLVELPFQMTHRDYEPQELEGNISNLVRISAGLEDKDDLIADLKEAFKTCQEA
ncbi:MAG: PLP-dependent aspartate aminotransferase family protein [Fusobacteria bacterium]|nr:PLP-dependent aspartate aminotransferase family protein [Fusobacteriota bacterium]